MRPLRPGGDENRFLDGVEQSLPEIVAHRYAFVTPGRTVALNATLWPRVSAVIMKALHVPQTHLRQRSALSRPATAIEPATAQLVRAEAGAIAVLCRPPHDDPNLFQLIWLTPSGQRSLRRAVRPVYDVSSATLRHVPRSRRPTLRDPPRKPSPLICRGRAARPFRPTNPEPLQTEGALNRTGPREWSSARMTLRGDALLRDRPVRRVMSVRAHLAGGLIALGPTSRLRPTRPAVTAGTAPASCSRQPLGCTAT